MEEMGIEDKDKIIEILKSAPAGLEADDIEDFCSLAQYYASKTPQSFRRVSTAIVISHTPNSAGDSNYILFTSSRIVCCCCCCHCFHIIRV